ncbi:unnamed protein product [Medioppia subpectinata]|uniref:Fatty acid desaturase domain-containing protein n=1 Tax=Medioppia subpectinata TaxID=1979941 RepID=A0A7R9PTZ2_9ACAR|nr:unnamed protein product [Medioppia subpectinata]CAG2101175.1 unnamed protein product [Medioppia subpectinata]
MTTKVMNNGSVKVYPNGHTSGTGHNTAPVVTPAYKPVIKYRNSHMVWMPVVHLSAIYGLYLAVTVAQFKTIMFMNVLVMNTKVFDIGSVKTDPNGQPGSDRAPVVTQVYKPVIKYRNSHMVWMPVVHMSAIYGLYLSVTVAQFKTIMFMNVMAFMASFGTLCGAHRLWSHRSYKAKLPLRIILMSLQTLAFIADIREWARDHRLHHKHSDTDADPHNSRRGFFFAHIGWIFYRKHPDVIAKGKTIDVADLDADPVVSFQHRYYLVLVLFIWGLGPAYVPYWLWSESLWCSWFVAVMLRYCISLHTSFLINGAAHMYGMKPYDNSIIPVEANVRHFMVGEGFHNYHHTFPQDYSASEMGAIDSFNPQTAFIDMFAAIGWAYDLKKPSIDNVKSRRIRSGDNSNQISRSRLSEQIVGLVTVFMPFLAITILRMNAFVWPVIPIALYLIASHPHGFSTNKTNMVTEEVGNGCDGSAPAPTPAPYKPELKFNNRHMIIMPVIHLSAIYGLYLAVTEAQFMTIFYMNVMAFMASFGTLCGSHRLWSHRSYKAKLPLRIILMVLQTLAFISDIHDWARDHRLHHKHSDTDADPHNARRGFLFSHIGWIFYRKHPDVIAKGKTIDVSDLLADPVVSFQHRHYFVLGLFIWGLGPAFVPYWLWSESLWCSWFVAVMLRYVISLHTSFLINSAAHMYGMKVFMHVN